MELRSTPVRNLKGYGLKTQAVNKLAKAGYETLGDVLDAGKETVSGITYVTDEAVSVIWGLFTAEDEPEVQEPEVIPEPVDLAEEKRAKVDAGIEQAKDDVKAIDSAIEAIVALSPTAFSKMVKRQILDQLKQRRKGLIRKVVLMGGKT